MTMVVCLALLATIPATLGDAIAHQEDKENGAGKPPLSKWLMQLRDMK